MKNITNTILNVSKGWKIQLTRMSLESKKPRIYITGHTRGIGKAIFDLYKGKNFLCHGVSKSTGMDIDKDCDTIVQQMATAHCLTHMKKIR